MIESIEDMSVNKKKFICRCDKSGVLFERTKKKDSNGYEPRLSNTEASLCDAEIEKFKSWLTEQGYGGDCWCKYLKKYTGEMETV